MTKRELKLLGSKLRDPEEFERTISKDSVVQMHRQKTAQLMEGIDQVGEEFREFIKKKKKQKYIRSIQLTSQINFDRKSSGLRYRDDVFEMKGAEEFIKFLPKNEDGTIDMEEVIQTKEDEN